MDFSDKNEYVICTKCKYRRLLGEKICPKCGNTKWQSPIIVSSGKTKKTSGKPGVDIEKKKTRLTKASIVAFAFFIIGFIFKIEGLLVLSIFILVYIVKLVLDILWNCWNKEIVKRIPLYGMLLIYIGVFLLVRKYLTISFFEVLIGVLHFIYFCLFFWRLGNNILTMKLTDLPQDFNSYIAKSFILALVILFIVPNFSWKLPGIAVLIGMVLIYVIVLGCISFKAIPTLSKLKFSVVVVLSILVPYNILIFLWPSSSFGYKGCQALFINYLVTISQLAIIELILWIYEKIRLKFKD